PNNSVCLRRYLLKAVGHVFTNPCQSLKLYHDSFQINYLRIRSVPVRVPPGSHYRLRLFRSHSIIRCRHFFPTWSRKSPRSPKSILNITTPPTATTSITGNIHPSMAIANHIHAARTTQPILYKMMRPVFCTARYG